MGEYVLAEQTHATVREVRWQAAVLPCGVACSVTPTTLLALVSDLVESLSLQGVKKLVLLNGHGGNELKPLTRQLHHRTDVFLCVCDWYRVAVDQYKGLFDRPGE